MKLRTNLKAIFSYHLLHMDVSMLADLHGFTQFSSLRELDQVYRTYQGQGKIGRDVVRVREKESQETPSYQNNFINWMYLSKFLRWSLIIVNTLNIRTIDFIFIVILTKFRLIRSSTFFQCFIHFSVLSRLSSSTWNNWRKPKDI